jgi:hypothetical protein
MKIDSVGDSVGSELGFGGGNSGHEKRDWITDPVTLAGSFAATVWI